MWRFRERRSGGDFLGPFRRISPIHAPLGAFVALSVLSCFFGTLPARSLLEIKGFGTFLLVPFAVAFLRDEEDVHLAVDIFRLTALYLVLRGFADYLAGRDNLDARIAGGLSHYMTYSGLLLLLVLVLAGRGMSRERRPASRAADLLIALAGATAVVLSLTRNAYLGLAVGAVALVIVSRPRWAALVPLLLAAFFLAMPPAVGERALSSFDTRDVTMRDRLKMWEAGAAMIADRPFFGVGPGRVKELYPVYRRPGWVEPHPGHLHDNVVMVAAETGIPSALAYLAFVAAFFVHARRRFDATHGTAYRGVVRGSIAAVAALFFAGLFEYNFGDVEVLMGTLVVASLPFCVIPLPPKSAGAPA